MGLWVEILFILVLVVGNGLLSMSETAIVSSRQARLQQRADRGEAGAGLALSLTQRPNLFLATVQIGITLVGVLSGAFGGATAARSLADLLARLDPLAPYASQIALVVVVLLITYLSLIVGELVPKRLALNNPEAIASRVAGPMSTLARLGSPLVKLLSSSTDGVLRLVGVREHDAPPISAEEIGILLEQGARAGIFRAAEQEMVEGVFDLADDPVAAHMTPRTNVVWLDLDVSFAAQRQTMLASPHTRFPLCRGEVDQVAGIVSTKDLLALQLVGASIDLEQVARPAHFVPESMSVLHLLEHFRRSHDHMAVVIDEFGGVAGIISLQDVLEAIVGDLPSGTGTPNPAMLSRPDGSWLLDGALPYDEAAELLGLDEDANAEGGYHTLAGFVLDTLGHLPAAGEQFVTGSWTIEIVDLDGHRIDKLSATPVHSPPSSSLHG